MPDLTEAAPTNVVREFDTYPHPKEFLRYGGIPGVSYLYVLAKNQADAATAGWSPINNMPFFKVKGHAMTFMAKGRPSLRCAPGTSRPCFFLDKEAPEVVGLGLDLEGNTKEASHNISGIPPASPPKIKRATAPHVSPTRQP